MPLFPVPEEGPQHPKQQLHDAVQQSLLGVAGLENAVATRWIVVVEAALQEHQLGLITITGTPAMTDLRSWEQAGMLTTALTRSLRGQT